MNDTQRYDIGDRIKLEVTFLNDAGAAATPDEVRLVILRPNGSYVFHSTTDVDSQITLDGTGIYSINLSAEHSGKHDFRWHAIGEGAGTEEGYFWVSLNKLDQVDT